MPVPSQPSSPAVSAATALRGVALSHPPLPALLQRPPASGARGAEAATAEADAAAEALLSPDFVRVERAFALGDATREADASEPALAGLADDQVVMLELAEEGGTAITTAGALRERDTLWQIAASSGSSSSGSGGSSQRGVAPTRLFQRLYSLSFGDDDLLREVEDRLRRLARERLGQAVEEVVDISASWLATKVLLQVIEARLPAPPGLHRWGGGAIGTAPPLAADDPALRADAERGLLLFLHGTGSCTQGSFRELASPAAGVWPLLRSAFGERIFGFEQRTFSVSPIDNALALARVLPRGARLHLVSHGSGGLVADLLCAERIDDGLIEAYRHPPAKEARITRQREAAAAEQRERLRDLRAVLAEKAFRIERCVRVASPARGTRLVGENLDIFLSVLLSLLTSLPPLAGLPVVAVLKRLVLEVVRRRLDPCLVPGLAALAPDAPLATLLAGIPPRSGLAMAIIAGHREGGHPLEKLALLFTDSVFFQRAPNDLVVDTDAMGAGIALRAGARVLLERGAGVSHMHYFSRPGCALALARWLTERQPLELDAFRAGTGGTAARERARTGDADARAEQARAAGRAASSGAASGGAALPVVVIVPDLMGSHLWDQTRQERLWLDPGPGLAERLRRLSDLRDLAVEPERLVEALYGDLGEALQLSHRVVRFASDWRQPLEAQAERLGALLRPLVAEAAEGRPVRLLAHGLGGLIVRGLIAREPALWQQLIQREGARLLFLGTPHHGSHQIVETLLGKAPLIRNLARMNEGLAMEELLTLLGGWPGLLQLLPRPGAAEGTAPETELLGGLSWSDEALWRRLKEHNRDRWFGDQLGALPSADALRQGRWLWDQEASGAGIPGDPERVIQVLGQAPRTPCGVALRDGQLVMLCTTAGDGVVPWRASRLEGIGHTYRAAADHGGLACRPDLFPALVELLVEGRTSALAALPRLRGARDVEPPPLPWQPGPTPVPSQDELVRGLAGEEPPAPAPAEVAPALRVSCQAMDLRYANHPVMVGHYENDSIAAAEALLDRDIVAGELSSRRRLGLYAGRQGTSTVVLMTPTSRERGQGSRRGAVVIGLGPMGQLSTQALTEAVRLGTLRYLLQLLDRAEGSGASPRGVGLASLLIGQNSSGDIAIEDSVAALTQGVLTANAQFAETFPGVALRVDHLHLVELFLDTAITATRALAGLEARWNRDGARVLAVERELRLGKGWRHRLDAAQESGYWPRLMVSNGAPAGEATSRGVSGPGVTLANALTFSFLGQRARAETQQQRRQNGLVEALVAASIDKPAINPDLCRTLFQLLVPSSFKDLARQLDQLVLVLDETTANLPWELLMADDKPLALQLAVVRQLQAPSYRQGLRQTTNRTACVIGNPDSKGFTTVFAGSGGSGDTGLPSLEGASEEAEHVLRQLEQHGYACEASLREENGVDVINKLYRQPYRLLHIAGHGVFEHPTHDGERRSGVVLADGLLITAAEIEAMEVVPDLVFLNCCHLGTVKREAVAFNKLAASVAGQLICMGVRAVVACGWAVHDGAALTFAETFYGAMLQGVPFGRAVFLARQAAHAAQPDSTTWGAYQAYGDPDYRLEELTDGSDPAPAPADADSAPPTWVTPLELIDQLQRLEGRLRHDPGASSGHPSVLKELERLLRGAPASWLGKASVAVAVADVHAALGGAWREEACQGYLNAIRCHQASDGLPIRAIEQLANLEARLGERANDAPRVEGAIARLRALLRLADGGTTPAAAPPEWQGLLGSACKRLAALRARALVASGHTGKEPLRSVLTPLEEAIAAYGQASGDPANTLNQLALEAVRTLQEPAAPATIRRARALLAELRRAAPAEPSFWTAVAIADALLVTRLVDRRLAAEDAAGEAAAREVVAAYQEVFAHGRGTPLERDSVVEQLDLLADLAAVRGRGRADPCPAAAPLAARLRAIGEALGDAGAASPSAAAEGEGDGSDADDDAVIVFA